MKEQRSLNVGNNLPADIVSFDGFSNRKIKDNFNKNKKVIYITLLISMATLLGLFFFLN